MNTLEICDLTKKYKTKMALKDFSFTLQGGEIVGLIGVNGAGKTTMLNTIAGNIMPSSGCMRFNGELFTERSIVKRDFGILIEPGFYDYMNAYDNLKSVLYLNDELAGAREKIKDVLTIVGLQNEEKNYVKSFSFGMKQRLGFAQALLNAKRMMLLDEPFVGLDINGRNVVKSYIKQYVKEKKIGVVFSDHNLDEVKDLCNRVIVIKNGEKIYDGDLISKKMVFVQVENAENANQLTGFDFEVVDDNWLTFDTSDLHNKLSAIISLFNVTDISKDENPLERMLKDEPNDIDEAH